MDNVDAVSNEPDRNGDKLYEEVDDSQSYVVIG